jgi:hypothetical protein
MLFVIEIWISVNVLAQFEYYISCACFQIPYGGKYGKEYILKTVATVAPKVFIPLNVSSLLFFHYVTANECFYQQCQITGELG